MKPKILVVDDEPDALELISFNLKLVGCEIITADNGADAIKKARVFLPNAIILDLMIPEVDGLEVCKILRRDKHAANIPIMMVTAKAEELDRVLGLELGANDYMTKPFSPRELVLRVKNLLTVPGPKAPSKELLEVGDIFIDASRYLVKVRGKPVELTAIEFKLLRTLAERRGRVQTREILLSDVWEYESSVDTRTVDTHMRRLRLKLGKASENIQTLRGVGYRFRDSIE